MAQNMKSTPASIRIIQADLNLPEHQRAVGELTSMYAADEMGNGAPLSTEILSRLIPGLRNHPTTIIFLAYDGEKPVGIANCFLGFSTFAAKPLINIHDLAVVPERRGQHVGRALLEAVEQHARQFGCAKVTLEVQENNKRAQQVYKSAGFVGGSYFYAKKL
jgi:ribosomal protein S18 acetylase RimI-like enzyme